MLLIVRAPLLGVRAFRGGTVKDALASFFERRGRALFAFLGDPRVFMSWLRIGQHVWFTEDGLGTRRADLPLGAAGTGAPQITIGRSVMPYVSVGGENSGSIDLYYEDHGSGHP